MCQFSRHSQLMGKSNFFHLHAFFFFVVCYQEKDGWFWSLKKKKGHETRLYRCDKGQTELQFITQKIVLSVIYWEEMLAYSNIYHSAYSQETKIFFGDDPRRNKKKWQENDFRAIYKFISNEYTLNVQYFITC